MWGVLSYLIINNFFFSKVYVYVSFVSLLGLMLLDFSWPIIFTFYGVLEKMKMGLIFLTVMIIYLMGFESQTSWLRMNMFLLGMLLVLCFLVKDLLLFFFFFELSLLPTTYIIFTWGVQPERLTASSYFLIYALMGSFPLLANMVSFASVKGNYLFILKFLSKTNYLISFSGNKILSVFWVFSFLMKLPMYSVHLWLPKAHVEAPVYGSMILAAVLLKLGGYGLIRLSGYGIISFTYLLYWVLLSSLMVGLITFRSKDLKSLIAYSSMSHMAFTVAFFFYSSLISIWAVLFILMGHGFISSAMFHSFNMLYSNTHSRKIFLNKGNKNSSSIFYFFFFFILCLNSSLPMKVTFFSEIILSITLFLMSSGFLMVFCLSVFLIGLFKMNIFLVTNQGNYLSSLYNSRSSKFSKIGSFISLFHMMVKFFFVLSLKSIF